MAKNSAKDNWRQVKDDAHATIAANVAAATDRVTEKVEFGFFPQEEGKVGGAPECPRVSGCSNTNDPSTGDCVNDIPWQYRARAYPSVAYAVRASMLAAPPGQKTRVPFSVITVCGSRAGLLYAALERAVALAKSHPDARGVRFDLEKELRELLGGKIGARPARGSHHPLSFLPPQLRVDQVRALAKKAQRAGLKINKNFHVEGGEDISETYPVQQEWGRFADSFQPSSGSAGLFLTQLPTSDKSVLSWALGQLRTMVSTTNHALWTFLFSAVDVALTSVHSLVTMATWRMCQEAVQALLAHWLPFGMGKGMPADMEHLIAYWTGSKGGFVGGTWTGYLTGAPFAMVLKLFSFVLNIGHWTSKNVLNMETVEPVFVNASFGQYFSFNTGVIGPICCVTSMVTMWLSAMLVNGCTTFIRFIGNTLGSALGSRFASGCVVTAMQPLIRFMVYIFTKASDAIDYFRSGKDSATGGFTVGPNASLVFNDMARGYLWKEIRFLAKLGSPEKMATEWWLGPTPPEKIVQMFESGHMSKIDVLAREIEQEMVRHNEGADPLNATEMGMLENLQKEVKGHGQYLDETLATFTKQIEHMALAPEANNVTKAGADRLVHIVTTATIHSPSPGSGVTGKFVQAIAGIQTGKTALEKEAAKENRGLEALFGMDAKKMSEAEQTQVRSVAMQFGVAEDVLRNNDSKALFDSFKVAYDQWGDAAIRNMSDLKEATDPYMTQHKFGNAAQSKRGIAGTWFVATQFSAHLGTADSSSTLGAAMRNPSSGHAIELYGALQNRSDFLTTVEITSGLNTDVTTGSKTAADEGLMSAYYESMKKMATNASNNKAATIRGGIVGLVKIGFYNVLPVYFRTTSIFTGHLMLNLALAAPDLARQGLPSILATVRTINSKWWQRSRLPIDEEAFKGDAGKQLDMYMKNSMLVLRTQLELLDAASNFSSTRGVFSSKAETEITESYARVMHGYNDMVSKMKDVVGDYQMQRADKGAGVVLEAKLRQLNNKQRDLLADPSPVAQAKAAELEPEVKRLSEELNNRAARMRSRVETVFRARAATRENGASVIPSFNDMIHELSKVSPNNA